MSIFNEIHKYLAADIEAINKIIVKHLQGRDKLIKVLSEHLINAGGKRIRPILTILTYKMFDKKIDGALKLATAIEFIHAGTLLHDDVVDESAMRRFKPTANFIWGNKASILVGDYLLSQAFELMISVKSLEALECISNATSNLIEGEVIQLKMLVERKILTDKEYDRLITAKTAELFGAACKVGAIVANKPADICETLQNFGIVLGKIFQITDDLLDYLGKSEWIGKNIGDDFYEGKVTLPIIYLYDKLSSLEKLEIENIFKAAQRLPEEFATVIKQLKQYNIEEEIFSYLSILKSQAYSMIEKINVNDENCKNYLTSLVDFSMNRIY